MDDESVKRNKLLNTFCVFINKNVYANGSTTSYSVIKQNKLTVYFIWGIIQKV